MSEEKINLEEIIKEELYNKHLYFNKTNTVQIKNICLEFGKQLLELAAKNAKTYTETYCSSYKEEWDKIVDKQSILNTIKQVE